MIPKEEANALRLPVFDASRNIDAVAENLRQIVAPFARFAFPTGVEREVFPPHRRREVDKFSNLSVRNLATVFRRPPVPSAVPRLDPGRVKITRRRDVFDDSGVVNQIDRLFSEQNDAPRRLSFRTANDGAAFVVARRQPKFNRRRRLRRRSELRARPVEQIGLGQRRDKAFALND